MANIDDIKRLRAATGAGISDCKKALEATHDDFEAAVKWLREKGLAGAQNRSGRENTQGAVAVAVNGNAAAIVELKCETDFVAKSPDFVKLVSELADIVAADGEQAAAARAEEIAALNLTLKENIALGRVVRFETDGPDAVLDTYLHVQNGRGVNAVMVELIGGTRELAHDVAVHVAFARPEYLRREDVPAERVAEERATLEAQTLNEGKPEAAIPKIVEGKLNGFFKAVPGGVLLEQPFTKDDKQTVAQALGEAKVSRFAQVVVGG
jgi:elongation factor Ts